MFGILWWLPPLPDFDLGARPSRNQSVIAEARRNNTKIVWYRRDQKLPTIAPSPTTSEPGKVQVKGQGLYIHVAPPGAQHKDQFINLREPKIAEQKALPSPNVVMTDLVAPPAPPKREARPFVPPPEQRKKPGTASLEEPQIAAAAELAKAQQSSLPESLQRAGKPAARKFVAPEEKTQRQPGQVVLAEPVGVPQGGTALDAPKLSLDNGLSTAAKPQARKLVLPPSQSGAGGGGKPGTGAQLEDPGLLASGGQPGVPSDVSAVILSANPTTDGRLVRPEGNRKAQIESGADGEAGRGKGAGGGSADLVIPGLTVRGGGAGGAVVSSARNDMPESGAPSGMTPTRPAPYRPRLDTPSVSIPQWPNTRRVPPAVEGAFTGRPVYSTVIAGLTGYTDWVLWFGELASDTARTRSVMRPPRLASGATLLAAAHLPATGKCWVKAKLSRGGKLMSLDVIQGLGAEQALELANTLEKWLWTPAIRNGEAVDVEVLMEVDLRRGN
ncbi:hypothetical protein [Paludibaculum fermentans]|uniref:hypothetical protein n=1 Tax=Paludibaculum fermentans TaxID=1473598 RepID=UPI003EC0A6E9